MSAFHEAVKMMAEQRRSEARCPHCGELDRPGASMITREQDGSSFCSVCNTKFYPPKESQNGR